MASSIGRTILSDSLPSCSSHKMIIMVSSSALQHSLADRSIGRGALSASFLRGDAESFAPLMRAAAGRCLMMTETSSSHHDHSSHHGGGLISASMRPRWQPLSGSSRYHRGVARILSATGGLGRGAVASDTHTSTTSGASSAPDSTTEMSSSLSATSHGQPYQLPGHWEKQMAKAPIGKQRVLKRCASVEERSPAGLTK